ncbi:MAG: hypothetical protein WC386_03030 [Candidatus Paceibacterota bacterium]|jgi:hypothetical protein
MSSQIINADEDSELRKRKKTEGSPLPKPKEPKVRTSRNGIMLVQ